MNLKINKEHFKHFPLLESERLLFRKLDYCDAGEMLLLRSDDEIMEYMDTKKLLTIDAVNNFITSLNEAFNTENGFTWAIIEKLTGRFAGHFEFWNLRAEHCRSEIGYALKREYWGKGYMTETLKTMINFGFKELKLHSMEANVNPLNQRSIKVLERNGFIKEAYYKENYLFNGKFLDSIIFSLVEPNL